MKTETTPERIQIPEGLELKLGNLGENQDFLLAVHQQIPGAVSANQIILSSDPVMSRKDGKISLELNYFALQAGLMNDKYHIQADFDEKEGFLGIRILKQGYD